MAEIEEMAKQIYRPQQFTLMLIEVEIRYGLMEFFLRISPRKKKFLEIRKLIDAFQPRCSCRRKPKKMNPFVEFNFLAAILFTHSI